MACVYNRLLASPKVREGHCMRDTWGFWAPVLQQEVLQGAQ